MNTIIVYGSHYGSSMEYAKKLSEIIKIPCFSYKEISTDCFVAKTVIYFGSLYAGGILGLQQFTNRMGLGKKDTTLIIVTVGLSDPNNKENMDNIKTQVVKFEEKNKITAKKIFHLRGNISYTKLSLKHRLLMKALHNSVKNKEKSELNSENIEFLETYGKEVKFVDFESLDTIVEWLTINQIS